MPVSTVLAAGEVDKGGKQMLIGALLSFGVLIIAWLVLPGKIGEATVDEQETTNTFPQELVGSRGHQTQASIL